MCKPGLILSILLFNLYSEAICHKALSETGGIIVKNEILNNNLHAYECLIMFHSSNVTDLKHITEQFNYYCNKDYDLKIKFMVFPIHRNIGTTLSINNIQIDKSILLYKCIRAD